MQCKEWGNANSELFKEPHDEAVHKNSYKRRLCELISASLIHQLTTCRRRRPPILDPDLRFQPLCGCMPTKAVNGQRTADRKSDF